MPLSGLTGNLVGLPSLSTICQLTHRLCCFSSPGIESKSIWRRDGVDRSGLVLYTGFKEFVPRSIQSGRVRSAAFLAIRPYRIPEGLKAATSALPLVVSGLG